MKRHRIKNLFFTHAPEQCHYISDNICSAVPDMHRTTWVWISDGQVKLFKVRRVGFKCMHPLFLRLFLKSSQIKFIQTDSPSFKKNSEFPNYTGRSFIISLFW